MSSHNLRVIFSEAAKADVVDILQYTYDTWGNVQMNAYSSVIDKALFSMSAHPHLGKKAPEIS